MRVPTGPFFFRLTFASPAGFRRDCELPPPVACGFPVFRDQSAGWANRALSLERDFIREVFMCEMSFRPGQRDRERRSYLGSGRFERGLMTRTRQGRGQWNRMA